VFKTEEDDGDSSNSSVNNRSVTTSRPVLPQQLSGKNNSNKKDQV
jgi:hypothetical protein